MPLPLEPKIYHIIHVDRLSSIIKDGFLWCDRKIAKRSTPGTTIGMSKIKERRLSKLTLSSHPNLLVGDCVPFYFCSRSIMLYLISQRNHIDLDYCGGQAPIIHLMTDLRETVAWADQNKQRWAFTLQNAGSYYFEDRNDLNQLGEIDWNAVEAEDWRDCKEGKQAEFLIENSFPWQLVSFIGVQSQQTYTQVNNALQITSSHKPRVEIKQNWYY